MNKKFYIVTPCFNEEDLIERFLDKIESKLKETNHFFTVVVVDDASTDLSKSFLEKYKFKSKNFTLKKVALNYNMGHQEAIRNGLDFVYCQNDSFHGVIVMDSDGEDNPDAIKELVKIEEFDIVFVTRGRRHDGIIFKIGYFLYKLFFKLIIGKSISYGNYSMISPLVLKGIHRRRFLHLASFLSKQRFSISTILFDRQKRIDGKSKMNLKSLVFHGLMSFLEYSEEVLFFLIKMFFITLMLLLFIGSYILYAKFIAGIAILGWTSSLGASLIIASLIIISTFILGLMLLSIKKTIVQNKNLSQNYEEF